MERGWTLLSVGTGVGLMYLMDPDRGRRRRALLRDKGVHWTHEARRALGLASRDLMNRSRGLIAGARHKVTSGDTSDDVLIERVRARIGHVVSHPHAIHVEVKDGCVTLTGAILAEEVVGCVEACETVPGVTTVESIFDVHEDADIPQLAGGLRRLIPRSRKGPTPGAQLATTVAGVACALYGRRRGGVLGFALRSGGILILLSELAGLNAVQDFISDVKPRLGMSR